MPSSGQNGLSRLVSWTSRPCTFSFALPDFGMSTGGTHGIVGGVRLAGPAFRLVTLRSSSVSRCPCVHGACGALRPSAVTTTRRHDETFVSHFDGLHPLEAPRFARWQG